MTVCIQELENGKVVGEWTAVSSVCAARNQLYAIKNTKTATSSGVIIEESRNFIALHYSDGSIRKYKIVKYFTKEPI